jgi:hypothetical protein
MAAVVKAAVEHNLERKETSAFQKEMGPMLRALTEGGLPDDYTPKDPKDKKQKHAAIHAAPASSTAAAAGDATAGAVTSHASASAWPHDEEDGPPVLSKATLGKFVLPLPGEVMKSDEDSVVLQRLYTDLDDVTHELKLRVPRAGGCTSRIHQLTHGSKATRCQPLNLRRTYWYVTV